MGPSLDLGIQKAPELVQDGPQLWECTVWGPPQALCWDEQIRLYSPLGGFQDAAHAIQDSSKVQVDKGYAQ